MSHIVRTVRALWEDLEPSATPTIPKGTYGICDDDDGEGYPLVNFGPPWGIQRVDNADIVDAAAVLLNAKRFIEGNPHLMARPWASVLRRVSKTFAGPYVVAALAEQGLVSSPHGSAVEAWIAKQYRGGKKKALALLDCAVKLTRQSSPTEEASS